jgi:ribonucleotide monophosphatase NagD (HAD superfamily)
MKIRRYNRMDITSVSTVVAIVVITYLIGLGAKAIPNVKDNYIPIIVGVAGGILGVVGMYVIADFPANDVLNAIAVGIVSGLASTGVNQIYKQVKNA